MEGINDIHESKDGKKINSMNYRNQGIFLGFEEMAAMEDTHGKSEEEKKKKKLTIVRLISKLNAILTENT